MLCCNNYVKYLLVIFILSLFINNCSESDNSGEIIHPQLDLIPANEKITKIEKPQQENTKLKETISSLINAEKAFSIGKEAGKKEELFGSIKGAAIDSELNIYILDKDLPGIRKYDSTGTLINTYGGAPGKGPGELLNPKDIVIKNDRIFVSDRYNLIKIFQPTQKGIEYLNSISTHVNAQDICILNKRIYVRSVGENKTKNSRIDTTNFSLVHAYSIEKGEYIQSFGEPYGHQNTRLSDGGTIECVESTNTIIYSFEYFPFLYGYSPSGELKWISEIEQFDGMDIIEQVRKGETIRFKYNSEWGTRVEVISSIQTIQDDLVLVQTINRKRSKNSNNQATINSYVISSKDGKGIHTTNEIPFISNMAKSRIYSRNVNSYPGIQVYEW